MPSPEMQDNIASLFAMREAAAAQPAPTIEQLRADFDSRGIRYPLPGDVLVSEIDAGGVPAHWLTAPGVAGNRTLLYLHGGGYWIGSIRSHGELAARLGRAIGTRVLFPEYRLAPEHPFPAAIDDALTVWRWLRDTHQVTGTEVAIAGDSAGGGLALALLTTLRDNGEDLAAAVVLMSPWTDLTGTGASMTERVAEDPIFTPEAVRQAADAYLARTDTDPHNPLASPLFARLDGLPPLLIQAGTAELLLSDSEGLAKAAAEAGMDVTLRVGDGLPHVYPAMDGTPEAAEATEQSAAFLRKHLAL